MNHPNLDYIRKFVDKGNPKDEYKLITEIGSGTYGDVYKAIDHKSQNYVAIKIMKIDVKDDAQAISQEIRTLRECKHHNIVQFYGSYLQSYKLWICMEYCGGQSMQDIYLNLRRPIDERTIAFITRETLCGLNYMHGLHKIHRDIKGANILLTEIGDVKIADFGIAASLSTTVAKRNTLIGTPYWMAPEVASVNNRQGGYDERCDVWAVGITAIEYAELQPPMFDLHPMKALQYLSQRSYTPPKLQEKDKWTPLFHNFLKYTLTKNERKRPSTDQLLKSDFVTQDNLTAALTQNLLMINRQESKFPYGGRGHGERKAKEPRPKGQQPNVQQNIPGLIPEHKSKNPNPAALEQVRIDGTKLGIGGEPNLIESPTNLSFGDGSVDEGHRSLLHDEGRNSFYDNYPKEMKSTNGVNNLPLSQRPANIQYPGIDNDQLAQQQLQQQQQQQQQQLAQQEQYNNTKPPKPCRPDKPPQYLSQLNDNEALATGEVNTGDKNSSSVDSNKQPKVSATSVMVDDYQQQQQFNIPSIPKVHMGACFVLMFEGCPLKINSSISWTNPMTQENLILLGTNDGIYYLNTNEMHENTLELLVARRCLWLSVVRDTLMSLSGKGPYLYSHNLTSLLRMKSQDATLSRLNKLLPKRFQPTTKIPDTKGCQMVNIIRNPFTGCKYLCAAVGKQIFVYEWFSPRSCFLEVKRVDVPIMPCPLLTFDLLVSREQNYPIVCLGVFRTGEQDKFKLNMVNLEENNRSVWFQSINEDDKLEVVRVIQIEPNTLLVCFPDHAIFLSMHGRLKMSRNKIKRIEFGPPGTTYINSVIGLRDSILVFHANGLKGVDFDGQITQDITDERHIYRLLTSDTYTGSILVESKSAETPMENGNIYMLVGHQDQ